METFVKVWTPEWAMAFFTADFLFHFCGCMAALWTLNKHLVGTTALNKETGVKSSSQTVHLWPRLEPSV